MSQTSYFWKGQAFLALSFFFLLVSCSAPSREWEFIYRRNHPIRFSSGKLLLSSDMSNNLDLEIVKGFRGMKMYINVHSLSIPTNPENPDKVIVLATWDGTVMEIEADRLRGGQRLLLSTDAANKIIALLENNQTITLSVGRYHGEIVPTGFSENYQKLDRLVPCDVF